MLNGRKTTSQKTKELIIEIQGNRCANSPFTPLKI